MRSKGQLSLDFILAVLFFIAAFQIVFSMASALDSSQSNIAVKTQLDVIAENLALKFSNAKLLEGSEIAQFSFSIPLITVPGEDTKSCEVFVTSGNSGTVVVHFPSQSSAKLSSKTVNAVIPSSFGSPLAFRCGSSYSCSFSSGSWSCP